jgi:hypothetical protein
MPGIVLARTGIVLDRAAIASDGTAVAVARAAIALEEPGTRRRSTSLLDLGVIGPLSRAAPPSASGRPALGGVVAWQQLLGRMR